MTTTTIPRTWPALGVGGGRTAAAVEAEARRRRRLGAGGGCADAVAAAAPWADASAAAAPRALQRDSLAPPTTPSSLRWGQLRPVVVQGDRKKPDPGSSTTTVFWETSPATTTSG